MIAHEVVHALQDEHFELTRGPFAPRPRDHDGELAAQALVEGDATEVQSRYVASLSPLALVGELARTLGAVPKGSSAETSRSSSASSCSRTPPGRSSCAPCAPAAGSACSTAPSATRRARPRRCWIPARYLAGDPPAQAVRLPAASYRFATSFGAQDLVALTGERQARAGLAGRAAGRRRRGPRPAPRDARRGVRGLRARRVLPASAAVAFRGRLVCVRIAHDKASGRAPSCR